MKKTTIAKIAALAMVPAMFWSQEGSAIPSFARKYQTSCYTCHSGFPTRNAFGEAFKNNGYRWPGGEDNEHAKQAQTTMGAEGWKKVFPESPWPTDIPGYAPFAFVASGNLLNYVEANQPKTGAKVGSTLNWSGPASGAIFYGATIGENLSVFGGLQGFGPATTNIATHGVRAVWSFSPGVLFAVGNNFSYLSGSGIISMGSVLPSASTSGAEFVYTAGEKGGVNIVAGVGSAGTGADNKLDDTRYLHAKYKLFGSGLLSGSNGTYGNEYNGLDNSLSIGAGVFEAKTAPTTGNFAGERAVYAVDVTGSYSNLTGGVAFGRDRDLKLNNFLADAGYYVYPWLQARVRYTSFKNGLNPTIAPSITAYPRANLSLAATYNHFTKSIVPVGAPSLTAGDENKDTFVVAASLAF